MRIGIRTLMTALLALLLCSCKESSTNGPVTSAPTFIVRASHCLDPALARLSALDSSFVYSFVDTLIVDFAVQGNCCPDSGRFDVSHSLGGDTLVISVTDTADHLCRCICTYFIHAEISHLAKDHYVVRCRLMNVDAPGINRDPAYLVDVYPLR